MTAMPDYYTILEVSPTATLAEIKRSYRRLVRKYHPDLHQQEVDQQIKLVNEAYEVLSNPEKRASYDAQCAEERRRIAAQESLRLKQVQIKQAKEEKKMTWAEGVVGFVRELRKELREK